MGGLVALARGNAAAVSAFGYDTTAAACAGEGGETARSVRSGPGAWQQQFPPGCFKMVM